MSDIHFDGVTETFNTAVYGTSKGFIRLGVLWEDLAQEVPEIKTKKLRILDVGGGMGQIALRLAHLGHDVVLSDPSEEMLSKAREVIGREKLDNVTLIHSSAQELSEHVSESFDLVMCHAVLEWVVSPNDLIGALSPFVQPSGSLSLMFYNQNAAVFKSILRGDFETFASPQAAREVEQSTPERSGTGTFSGARGLSEETVRQLLGKYGLEVRSKAGIRIFHDHIPEPLKGELAALLELEKNYRHTEPFASLAQHIHLVCGVAE